MKLLIQPGAGSTALVEAMNSAVKSIEIVIFRFDRREIEAALKAAAARGVFVHALVTYRNRGGEKNLRKLEMRLLEASDCGAHAGRSPRYRGKFMSVDRQELFLWHSTSPVLTLITAGASRWYLRILHWSEAGRLFEADCTRRPFTSQTDFGGEPCQRSDDWPISLKSPPRIGDLRPKISDPQMIRLLKQQNARESRCE